MPGMSASVSSSILVMENPSPTFSKVTFAPVWTRAGVRPARESCAVSAIVKHPAWAAPDQLLRVGGRLAFLESRLERIRAVEGAAADSQPPAPFGQIALPLRFCLPCWHGAAFRFAIVLGFTLRRAQWPEYDKYQAGTKRDIPVVLLSPR